ncbi:MAG TPA: DUF4129 domain-containing protein [Ilumatobacteraceae bacterium]|nr:DUF4129 domain-containing protein [Ilumatobacteraceae bacterium]
MPEPEANRPQPGPRRRPDPLLSGAVVIAIGLGLTVASGSVFGGSGTTASVSEAAAPAIVGALVGAAFCGVCLGVIRIWMTRHWRLVRPFAITAIVAALGLGALAGASTAPTEEFVEVLAPAGGAVTAVPTGSLAADGVVVPVDRNADGEPDTFEGELILGFDVDDDDVVDGFLRRCSGEPDPLVEERAGYLAIDLKCDSDVEEYLPYDEGRLLSAVVPEAVVAEDNSGIHAGTWITIGLVVMLLALLVALGYFLSQMALLERPLDREFVPLSTALMTKPDEPVDVDKVADLLQASLDGVLTGTDPRIAIRVAYGTLLDGLAGVGLARRPEEGPDEHMERCLRAAALPAGPIRELLRLFTLARFSSHPITEDHRNRAVAALDAAITSVRRLEVVG